MNYFLPKREIHCFPNIPEIPEAIPPIIPVTIIKRNALPCNGNSTAIFFARIKSFVLLKRYACTIHNKAMAKNGTKNTALLFKLINKDVKKDAIITDHQGKNCDSTRAIIIVAIKLMLFFFIV